MLSIDINLFLVDCTHDNNGHAHDNYKITSCHNCNDDINESAEIFPIIVLVIIYFCHYSSEARDTKHEQ